jgi:hypothetical protein
METAVVTEAPQTDVKPVEEVKEVPKEQPKEQVSDKFAALARKEKSIVKARQELAAEKAKIQQEMNQLKAQMLDFDRFKRLKENAKTDPDAYLKEAGLSYGYLTEQNLKGGIDPNAILEKTEQKLSEWEKKQEEAQKKIEEGQKAQAAREWQEKVQGFVQSINDFVEENKDTYELIALHGQQPLVWEVIQEAARRNDVMTVKDAATKVEAYLSEQVEKAMTNSKKFKDKYELKKVPEPPKVPGSPTLSNSMGATTPVKPGMITEAERTARALAALNKALGE